MPEVTEPGYLDEALLDMLESPEPSRRKDRAIFEAKTKREENLDIVIEEVKSHSSRVKTM